MLSAGDEGGPLTTNGAIHTGEIVQGYVDIWTFTATAGDRIGVHIGKISETDNYVPWIRLWGPTGTALGNTWGADAAVMEAVASVTGTYMLLVGSADSGVDGTGTYQLTMTHTPGPVNVSPGDQGGAITIGAAHTGEIVQGDVDVRTVNAIAGQKLIVQISQISETDNFVPWIRVWGPNGVVLGNTWGNDNAVINATAGVTGTYLVLVASADSGVNGTGTYQLTVTH